MPRFPEIGSRVDAIPAATFTTFASRIAELKRSGKLVPLHIGDTFELPAPGATEVALGDAGVHRYGPVTGDPALRDAVATRILPGLGITAPADQVVMTPGATGGLLLSCAAICDPGDEIIVVTPSWPLIFGILPSVAATAVQVPIDPDGWPRDAEDFERRLRSAVTERTVGIYFSDPNNPVGFVYPRTFRETIAGVARELDLWLVHDAVYGQLHWAAEPIDWPGAGAGPERLITVGSFSKSHALAGHRVGFVALPPSLTPAAQRLITHTCYHTGTAGQAMALASLQASTDDFAGIMCERYRSAAVAAGEALGARFQVPEGGGFLFIDIRRGPRTPEDALLACLDQGVALAPGSVFGGGFEGFARLCFTAVPESQVVDACRRISPILGV